MPIVDITNQKFGKLNVVKQTEDYIKPKKKKKQPVFVPDSENPFGIMNISERYFHSSQSGNRDLQLFIRFLIF